MEPAIVTIDGKNTHYLPLMDLIESMKVHLHMPYSSIFSYQPLIQKLHNRIEHTECEMTAQMLPRVEAMEELLAASKGVIDDELQQSIDGLTRMLLPSMYFEGEYGFICPPFVKEFIYATPSMTDLYDKNKWLVKISEEFLVRKEYGSVQNVAAVILNKFYGQQLDMSYRDNMTFRNVQTGREMHLRLDVREDYIDISVNGELPEINDEQMNYLLNHFKDDEVVLEFLPPEKFTLKGMGIGVFNDVSDLEIQSLIKDAMLNAGQMAPDYFMSFIKQQLNDFLKRDDIDVGLADLLLDDTEGLRSMSLSGSDQLLQLPSKVLDHDTCQPYHKAYCKKENVILSDLDAMDVKGEIEEGLIQKGFKSAILIPLTDSLGKVSTILELASKNRYAFNTTSLQRLLPIIELMALGNEVYRGEFNNKVERFIKTKFTAIHPSVQWKFEEIATKHQIRADKGLPDEEMQPVVFRDIYPLYGQVDINNSSNLRNQAIKEDLIVNLNLVIDVLKAYMNFVDFHLLDVYLLKSGDLLEQLETGYTSSLESAILEMLTREVHPVLRNLENQFPELPVELMNDYFAHLDPELNVVNKKRKNYEDSVNLLNTELSQFLDREDEQQQQILPHYFEKYKTDGIEYNLYLGQSMLKNLRYSDFHLKDFRLWQLAKTIEMTKLVEGLKYEMKVPLETSQLIFVYNSPMSVQFRMDEKRFDVEGSYNVRYEILKKRIDKAKVKGSGERITQAGKIAIVYLLDKDKDEYMGYLEYLVRKGLISPEIEDLELERLQGADGLRALRVTVNIPGLS